MEDPDRPDQRGILLPTGTMIMLPEEPSFAALVKTGGEVVKNAEPHSLCGGQFFGSGEIDRLTDYELGLVGHHSFRGDDCQPDARNFAPGRYAPSVVGTKYRLSALR